MYIYIAIVYKSLAVWMFMHVYNYVAIMHFVAVTWIYIVVMKILLFLTTIIIM